MSVQTDYYIPQIQKLDEQISRQATELTYLDAVHKNIVGYLASQYRNGMAVEIAGICDETLDRTGRLLGEVREAARKAP